ncbi:MAG: glycosyltransferase family 39 protein [Candidatus Hydrogenedentes bacterium]|nr:glycosyltransferase family 39 protein [Candidatus Hydrogenedentota bacterium]
MAPYGWQFCPVSFYNSAQLVIKGGVRTIDTKREQTGKHRETGLYAAYAIAGCLVLAFIVWCTKSRQVWMPDHVVPLYAQWKPSAVTPRHLVAVGLCIAFLAAIRWLRRMSPPLWLTLLVLICAGFLLNVSVASMNTGIGAVATPFERYGLEYYGDVPFVKNPVDFLHNFSVIRPELSMHGRTHPPGPILFLWLIWVLTGANVMAVSICTVALASVTVAPLYLLVRDMADRDTALTCSALYVCVPTTILYGATSMNAVYALFAVTTIWLFWKAMETRKLYNAGLFGLSFALTFFMSYDMANLGTFFVVVFVSSMFDSRFRKHAVTATTIAVAVFLSFYALLYFVAGFNVVASFRDAVVQVREDLFFMDTYTPRASYWVWRFANPVEVFFFAGIPVSVLFFAAWRSRFKRGAWRSRPDIYLLAGLCMMAVFNFTYLGKSEMARVSGYFFPFILIPAALYLQKVVERTGRYRPVYITTATLFVQSWLMETLLYMYW